MRTLLLHWRRTLVQLGHQSISSDERVFVLHPPQNASVERPDIDVHAYDQALEENMEGLMTPEALIDCRIQRA